MTAGEIAEVLLMIRRLRPLIAASCLLASSAWAGGCPRPAAGAPLPLEATPTQGTVMDWQGQQATLVHILASTDLSAVRMLFIGDSITANFQGLIYDQFYGTRSPLNLGVRGDTTQGVLWRLTNGPLGAQLRPQLVVLLIGTNNLWAGVDPNNVAIGIGQIIRLIEARSPTSHILLLGLLPRAASPADPFRQIVANVNQIIRRCADGRRVQYAEPGDMLVDGHGVLSNQIAFDYLHPTWMGYAILAAGIEPMVRAVVGTP